MRAPIRSAIVAIGIMITSPVTASVIVDTGPGPNTNDGPTLNSEQYLAAQFSVNSTSAIQSVFGWIGGSAGQTINLRLYLDGGTTPNYLPLLYSTTFVTSSGASWQGSNNLDWFVLSGDYWISFEGTALVDNAMPSPVPNPLEHYAYWELDNGMWAPNPPPFGVLIDAVPREPPPAVPEPSTWTTMLFGFGAMGFLLRRKHKVSGRFAGVTLPA